MAAYRQNARIHSGGVGPSVATWVRKIATVPVDGVMCADVPAVPSRHVPWIDRLDVDRAAEAPTLALEKKLADLALGGRGVVGDHELHGIGRQQPAAAAGSAS